MSKPAPLRLVPFAAEPRVPCRCDPLRLTVYLVVPLAWLALLAFIVTKIARMF